MTLGVRQHGRILGAEIYVERKICGSVVDNEEQTVIKIENDQDEQGGQGRGKETRNGREVIC